MSDVDNAGTAKLDYQVKNYSFKDQVRILKFLIRW